MLPFDNKSELQVVVDLPEGRTLEDTGALLTELAAMLDQVPEVLHYQGYAGTAAPINFNGLVRQYDLRAGANLGDLQVNLVDRRERSRKSHDRSEEHTSELQSLMRISYAVFCLKKKKQKKHKHTGDNTKKQVDVDQRQT